MDGYCIECNKPTKNPKFCSSSCSAKYSNRNRVKKYRRLDGVCDYCSVKINIRYKYCENCKPRKRISKRVGELTNFCSICGILKNLQNTRKNLNIKNGLDTYCKKCVCQLNALKMRRAKQERVDYKGSKCERCGYNKCLSALQFHHIDKSIKSFGISALNTDYNSKRIFEELDKCILLCANCHNEEHYIKYDFEEKIIEYELKLYNLRNKKSDLST